MLVGKRMSKDPVTVTPQDSLAVVQARLEAGRFRRVPVLENGKLVGLISDRDMREHAGHLADTKVNVAMTENLMTVTPLTTLEEAAQLLLQHKMGALPVLEEGRLVGIITTSDILKAFLEVMGASEKGTVRIDLVLEGEQHDLTGATKAIAEEGGDTLGVGTYREKWGERPVFYLRLRAPDPARIAEALEKRGYEVLGVHR